MTKVVVYALLTTAFIIFLTFSPNKKPAHAGLLNRRLGNDFPLPAFDPLVVKLERLKQEKGSLNLNTNSTTLVHDQTENLDNDQTENQDNDIRHESFSEGGKLNITARLIILFPLVDNNPHDEFVSFDELEAWNIGQAIDRLGYRTKKEMMSHDINGDGLISFSEYLPHFSKEDIEKNGMAQDEAGWWMEKFVNADVDQNGFLTFDEFNNFLHPEDSENVNIQIWNLKEKIKAIDQDDDCKLNIDEFTKDAYGLYKHYADFEISGDKIPSAEEIFKRLDVNNDKFLEPEELRPMYRYLYPGEFTYARYFTNYLMQEADDNKDGKLTLSEMLNNEYIFYSTVYHEEEDDYDTDDEDYDGFHDELR
ncbi:hypothetical protein ACFE04_010921 [Oxalis oulophora]